MVAPWFERWPELAAWELTRFEKLGLPAEVDVEARSGGMFVVRTETRFGGEPVQLEVRYPSETPELPPVVFAKPGLLGRHQQPFGGNFCLLERPLDDWPSGSWGAADLIAERLTALLDDSWKGPEAVRAAEAPMPEPFTAHYRYPFGPVVLMPEELLDPPGSSGSLTLRGLDPNSFRFLVESVDGRRGPEPILSALPAGTVMKVPWKRVAAPPAAEDGPGVAHWIRQMESGLLRRPVPAKLAASKHLSIPRIQIAGLVFEEEGPEVGASRAAWLFVCVPNGKEEEAFLAHNQIFGPSERFRRVPELRSLTDARVVVIGLGTLGGYVAVELARAGVGRLDLIDDDRFEVNNTVRHVLGIEWSGHAKTQAVAVACRRANPICQPRPHQILFGETGWTSRSADDRLAELVEGADLVVETTGSHQLQAYTARVAASADVPFVSAWLTEGFWGAHVVRIDPPRTACFICFSRSLRQGDLHQALAGPDSPVIAQGCSHPTVSGSGFDALEASAITTRLAVQTMLRGEGYPESQWDHAALNLRQDPADASRPHLEGERLPPTEGCPRCGSVVGLSKAL